MSNVTFEDYSVQVKDLIKEKALVFLEKAGGEIASVTRRNTRVRSGHTKESFQHLVDESDLKCSVGSNYQNAIWEEFGTGIYAFNGDGRKTPWRYTDADGNEHWTRGKRPQRTLFKAYQSLRGFLQRLAERTFGEIK